MKWCKRSWYVALVGLCCLLLLGCLEDDQEDEQTDQPQPEPTITELGLRLAPVGLDLSGLSPAEVDQVALGSYLVNGAGLCAGCHNRPPPPDDEDEPAQPEDYLAGNRHASYGRRVYREHAHR
jgi:hypothetical protein